MIKKHILYVLFSIFSFVGNNYSQTGTGDVGSSDGSPLLTLSLDKNHPSNNISSNADKNKAYSKSLNNQTVLIKAKTEDSKLPNYSIIEVNEYKKRLNKRWKISNSTNLDSISFTVKSSSITNKSTSSTLLLKLKEEDSHCILLEVLFRKAPPILILDFILSRKVFS